MPPSRPAEKRRSVKLWHAIVAGVGALAIGFISGLGSSVGEHVLSGATVADVPSPAAGESGDCPALGIDSGRLGEETLTILIRKSENDCWANTVTDLRIGDRLFISFQYINLTGEDVQNATIVGWISEGLVYVPGSTTVKNSNNPDRKTISDGLLDPGINIGDYANRSNAFVRFEVVYQGSSDCGLQTEIVGVRFQDDLNWLTAGVLNQIPCPPNAEKTDSTPIR